MRIYEERELTPDEQNTVVKNLGLIRLAHSRYPRLAARVGPDSEGIAAAAVKQTKKAGMEQLRELLSV